jgi:uncharacterized membrane protein YkoI
LLRTRRTWQACVCAVLQLGAVAAIARPEPEQSVAFAQEDLPPATIAQRGSLSLQQATAIATRQYQGRVVRAETVSRGGRLIHEVRILGDDGRVRTVRIDAETGQFL